MLMSKNELAMDQLFRVVIMVSLWKDKIENSQELRCLIATCAFQNI